MREHHSERETVKCQVLQTAQGPAVQYVELSIADQSVAAIKGWQGNSAPTAPNVWLFTGRLTLVETLARVANNTDGAVDGICLSDSAATEWNIDEDTRIITVLFETLNTSGATQTANLVVMERTRDRVGLG